MNSGIAQKGQCDIKFFAGHLGKNLVDETSLRWSWGGLCGEEGGWKAEQGGEEEPWCEKP